MINIDLISKAKNIKQTSTKTGLFNYFVIQKNLKKSPRSGKILDKLDVSIGEHYRTAMKIKNKYKKEVWGNGYVVVPRNSYFGNLLGQFEGTFPNRIDSDSFCEMMIDVYSNCLSGSKLDHMPDSFYYNNNEIAKCVDMIYDVDNNTLAEQYKNYRNAYIVCFNFIKLKELSCSENVNYLDDDFSKKSTIKWYTRCLRDYIQAFKLHNNNILRLNSDGEIYQFSLASPDEGTN